MGFLRPDTSITTNKCMFISSIMSYSDFEKSTDDKLNRTCSRTFPASKSKLFRT